MLWRRRLVMDKPWLASYPPGKFVQEFAKRTHENLLDLRKNRPLSHKDTALIGSLLAVFVLPHERADDREFMRGLLDGFDRRELEDIVRVLKIKPNARKTFPGRAAIPP